MPVGEVCQQPQAVCKSVQELVLIPKDWLQKTQPVQVWPGSQGNDREAELDSGYFKLLEDTHQMQGTSANLQHSSPPPVA